MTPTGDNLIIELFALHQQKKEIYRKSEVTSEEEDKTISLLDKVKRAWY